VSERILESNCCAKGSPFHTEGQPPRMQGPGLWRHKQKEQRVTPVPMSGVYCDLWGGRAKISEVGQSKTQDTPPDQGTNTKYDSLLEGQPVEYIKHVGRYVSSSRNASYEARGSADNPLEATQTHSRETNVECGAVVKPRCDKGVDKSSSSSISARVFSAFTLSDVECNCVSKSSRDDDSNVAEVKIFSNQKQNQYSLFLCFLLQGEKLFRLYVL